MPQVHKVYSQSKLKRGLRIDRVEERKKMKGILKNTDDDD